MKIVFPFFLIFFAFFFKCSFECECNSKCPIKSTMALKGRIRQIEEIDYLKNKTINKLSVIAVIYMDGIIFESDRYDLLKNESSFEIDWLPMSHDVVETSRRPPTLKSVNFVDVGIQTTAIVVELIFDILNMKLRSTYEIKVNSIFDNKCNEMRELSSYSSMNITFACERIIDSDCSDSVKIDHHPVCNFMRTYHTRIVENLKFDTNQIDILISIEKNDHRFQKLKYFVSFYGICDSIQDDECILDIQKSEIRRFCVPNHFNCSLNRSFALTIPNFINSEKYGIQICGVLDHRYEFPPIVSGTSKIIGDLLSISPNSSSLSIRSSSIDSLFRNLLGYAFVLAFLFIILLSFIIYKCTVGKSCSRKQKKRGSLLIDENSLTIFEDRIIGNGKFGAVYIGKLSSDWHGPVVLDDQQRVAVKSNQYLDKNQKREFVDEIEGTKFVERHSRILASIGTVMKNGNLLHVMEFCGNGNLFDYLTYKRKYMIELQQKGIDLNASLTSLSDIDFDEVVSIHDLYRIASQICTGMIYLSNKSIVHNALCAKHVLITLEHNVKISDFGYISTPNTPNSIPVDGLQKWTAPELLAGQYSTQLSDVWSFGITLWEIFTLGGRPYYNIPNSSIKGLIEKGFRLQKPEGCSLQLYQLLREMWLDNPTDRPSFVNISQRISTILQEFSSDDHDFLIISTLCDYYIENEEKRIQDWPIKSNSHISDPAALISESERLLGYRF